MSDDGSKEIFEDMDYYMPQMDCRLFSPQTWKATLVMDIRDPNKVYMKVLHDRVEFKLKSGRTLTVPYHLRSHLPILNVYKDLDGEAKKIS